MLKIKTVLASIKGCEVDCHGLAVGLVAVGAIGGGLVALAGIETVARLIGKVRDWWADQGERAPLVRVRPLPLSSPPLNLATIPVATFAPVQDASPPAYGCTMMTETPLGALTVAHRFMTPLTVREPIVHLDPPLIRAVERKVSKPRTRKAPSEAIVATAANKPIPIKAPRAPKRVSKALPIDDAPRAPKPTRARKSK